MYLDSHTGTLVTSDADSATATDMERLSTSPDAREYILAPLCACLLLPQKHPVHCCRPLLIARSPAASFSHVPAGVISAVVNDQGSPPKHELTSLLRQQLELDSDWSESLATLLPSRLSTAAEEAAGPVRAAELRRQFSEFVEDPVAFFVDLARSEAPQGAGAGHSNIRAWLKEAGLMSASIADLVDTFEEKMDWRPPYLAASVQLDNLSVALSDAQYRDVMHAVTVAGEGPQNMLPWYNTWELRRSVGLPDDDAATHDVDVTSPLITSTYRSLIQKKHQCVCRCCCRRGCRRGCCCAALVTHKHADCL